MNGKPVSPTRTELFGEGLFETFRWRGSPPVFFDDHYERMVRGAKVLGLPAVSKQRMLTAIKEALRATGVSDARVKVCLTSEGGYHLSAKPRRSKLVVGVAPYRPPKPAWRIHVVSFRRSSSSPVVAVKSTNYLENILGRREAEELGYDEGLFLNERGEVAEGCTTNIFWIKGRTLFTPSTACGILPGVTRKAVLSLAPSLGLRVKEARSPISALFSSDLVFLTNSIVGMVCVEEVDGKNLRIERGLYSRLKADLFRVLGWE